MSTPEKQVSEIPEASADDVNAARQKALELLRVAEIELMLLGDSYRLMAGCAQMSTEYRDKSRSQLIHDIQKLLSERSTDEPLAAPVTPNSPPDGTNDARWIDPDDYRPPASAASVGAVEEDWTVLDKGFLPNAVDIKCGDKTIAFDVSRTAAGRVINAHNASLASLRSLKGQRMI